MAHLEVLDVRLVAHDFRELAHCVDAYNSFEREISLQAEGTSKVVCRY